MAKRALVIAPRQIQRAILLVRRQKVILDMDLVGLYGVATKSVNRAVSRNRDRFPDDFMFQLSQDEFASLRYQIGTSKNRGGRRYAPYAFTEHGAIMAAGVLNTPRAIEVSVFVVRAFVKLREFIASNKELVRTFAELERQVGNHDEAIRSLVVTIHQLMEAPPEKGEGAFRFSWTGADLKAGIEFPLFFA